MRERERERQVKSLRSVWGNIMLAFLFLVYGSVTSSGISYRKNFRATALEGAELGIPLKTRKWNSSLRVFWARDQALLGERARATLAEVGAGRRL